MEDKANNVLSLKDLYYIFFKHIALITVLFFATVTTVVIGVYVLPEKYLARVSIIVKMGRENISIPAAPQSFQQQVLTTGLRKEDIISEIEIMKNRLIIEKVVSQIGTDHLFPEPVKPKTFIKLAKYYLKLTFNKIRSFVFEIFYRLNLLKRLSDYEIAVNSIQKNLSAEQIRDSDVIEMKLQWSDPDMAKKILDTLIEFYLVHHLDTHKTSGDQEFFQGQVEIIGKRLNDSEDRLNFLEEQQGIVSFEDQKRFLLEQVSVFEAEIKRTQTELAETATRIDELKKQQDSLMKAITPGFNAVNSELERDLLLQEVRLKALTVKKGQQEQHAGSYQRELERLKLHEIELKRLTRQIQIDEKNYLLYRQKLEEARISNVLDNKKIVNVRVVDPASASFAPVRPRKLLIIGLGLVLSLVFGIGCAFMAEYFDHSLKTPEDVMRHLNLPVLASVKETGKWLIWKNTKN